MDKTIIHCVVFPFCVCVILIPLRLSAYMYKSLQSVVREALRNGVANLI